MDLCLNNIKFFFLIFILMLISCILRSIVCMRPKRTLAFTSGNSFGFLAAVAIPVDLPNRNIYVAFNLETNYGLPPNDTHYNLIKKWNLNGMFGDISNGLTSIENTRHQRSLYTRNNFYRSVVGYMNHLGINGRNCLLRTICDISESRLYISNGVLGSILHILFMPTSSAYENISLSIYNAEEYGFREVCKFYERNCPESFLNKISVSL